MITESYLGLDQDVTGCQNQESIDSCKTRRYLDTLLRNCGCLPFSIRSSQKVQTLFCVSGVNTIIISILQEPICSADMFECMKSIKVNASGCLHPCSGLILSSFTKSVESKNLESLISREVIAYRNYTKWFRFPSGIKGENFSFGQKQK